MSFVEQIALQRKSVENCRNRNAVLILGKPQGVTLRLGMSHYRQPLHCSLHSTDILLHYAQVHIALCTAYADI